MAANGISTLATKQLRQEAKLNLAQAKRQTAGTGFRQWNVYDINALPTKYSNNNIVDNAGPLVAHRPWTGQI